MINLELIARPGLIDVSIEDICVRLERVDENLVAVVKAQRLNGSPRLFKDLGTEIIDLRNQGSFWRRTDTPTDTLQRICEQHGLSRGMAKRCVTDFMHQHEEVAS